MRSEKEMFNLILGEAKSDERIRGVILGGSRANPKAPKDIFQDYDIVYVTTDTESFISDKPWRQRFGESLITQMPDDMDRLLGADIDSSRHYTYLMQFTDGTRLDLTLQTLDYTLETIYDDSQTVILLDKDGVLPVLPPASDEKHIVKSPSPALFARCVNEFWWVALYVAKGLWRDELPYAMEQYNLYVHQELKTMVSWYAGYLNGFSLSVGKSGKYLRGLLPEEIWSRFVLTYPPCRCDAIGKALVDAGELFMELSGKLNTALELGCDFDEAKRAQGYITQVLALPKDAAEIC